MSPSEALRAAVELKQEALIVADEALDPYTLSSYEDTERAAGLRPVSQQSQDQTCDW